MDLFLSEDILKEISYTSALPQSLKTISLRKTPLEVILADIKEYRKMFSNTVVIQNKLIGSRFKSNDSILIKYEKTLRTGGGFKQCFNDILSFRLKFDEYPKEFPSYFRVVDLRNGKQIDDGYRAVHLYYQRDRHSYPIEVQLWCGKDYLFNLWSHKYVYKYSIPENGKLLYELYNSGTIQTEEEFYNEFMKLKRGNSNGR